MERENPVTGTDMDAAADAAAEEARFAGEIAALQGLARRVASKCIPMIKPTKNRLQAMHDIEYEALRQLKKGTFTRQEVHALFQYHELVRAGEANA